MIEKKWITKAGLPAKVRISPMGFRCGYVGVPVDVFGEKDYDDLDIDVHGGITYGKTENDGLRWYGFDCAHSGDARDPSLMDDVHRNFYLEHNFEEAFASVKTLAYCIDECEKLATQLKQIQETMK